MSKEDPQPTNKGGRPPLDASSSIISYGLDWLSCTTPSEPAARGWYDWFETIQQHHLPKPSPAQHARRVGYEGTVLSDNTFFGRRTRDNSWLWISSGGSAQRDWTQIAGLAQNITRIDLQVTSEFRRPRYRDVARDIYANRDLSRLQHTYYQSAYGSTCYVGSKRSDFFGRIYDKSRDYDISAGRVWRYEVVSRSRSVNRAIVSQMSDAVAAGTLHEWIARYVHTWFTERTARPGFAVDGQLTVVREAEVHVGYPDRQLKWLRMGVAPTVARLIRDGMLVEAMEALGIVHEAIPHWSPLPVPEAPEREGDTEAIPSWHWDEVHTTGPGSYGH